MAVKYVKPKGTQDVLPHESWMWQRLEKSVREVAALFGYKEIRLPTFESTELFSRGVGEGTDIVSKEMYTFEDKGGRSVTLRPEGTAGVVRAVLENGLLAISPLPLKSYYMQSCFRYENSQKGRFREFHQFGVECFGSHEPAADVEVMSVAQSLFHRMGVAEKISLQINSIGCSACRPAYHKALVAYYEQHRGKLCRTCLERLAHNPLRLLDCKEEACGVIAQSAPSILDYLCADCETHFSQTKQLLDEAGMAYRVNPRIVRGLDYYTNTVFEFIAEGIGAQGAVCAGGRYDGLIEELGGQPAPAVGYGLGLERLLMLAQECGRLTEGHGGPDIYLAAMDGPARTLARKLCRLLRGEDIRAECDLAGRSVKAQMKAAGRLGALFTIVLGDDEVKSGIVTLRRMSDGAEVQLPTVGVPSTFKYVLGQDPLAQSGEDLESLVQAAGPMVQFNGAIE